MMRSLLLALVACILCVGDPSAVFGAVVPVNIDAVNLQSREIAGGHVSHEVLKDVPSVADRNPASSIAMESMRFGAVAPMVHGLPFAVDGIQVQAMFGGDISLQASAAGDIPAFQLIDTGDVRKFAARAFTDGDVPIGANSLSDSSYCQSTEPLSDDNGIGRVRFEPQSSEIKHFGYPVTNYGLIVAFGVT